MLRHLDTLVTWVRQNGTFDLDLALGTEVVLATIPTGETLRRTIFGWTIQSWGFGEDGLYSLMPPVYAMVCTVATSYDSGLFPGGAVLTDVAAPTQRILYQETRRHVPVPLASAGAGLHACLWQDDLGPRELESEGQVLNNLPDSETLDVRLVIEVVASVPTVWTPQVAWWGAVLYL